MSSAAAVGGSAAGRGRAGRRLGSVDLRHRQFPSTRDQMELQR